VNDIGKEWEMLVAHDHKQQDLEDILRSLGALLDERQARGVVIIHVEGGLMVRARVTPTLEQRLLGDSISMERAFGRQDILEAQIAGVARRGTGHVAGPIERALRVIGRAADAQGLVGLTLIQHHTDDGWLVWHRTADGRQQLKTFDSAELERGDAELRAARYQRDGAPEEEAPPEPILPGSHPALA
jgi:hypothetical protein